MNERIRNLKNKVLDKHFSFTWTSMDYYDIEKFSEKFADLIVCKCADFADQGTRGGVGELMKKHFGVEE